MIPLSMIGMPLPAPGVPMAKVHKRIVVLHYDVSRLPFRLREIPWTPPWGERYAAHTRSRETGSTGHTDS